MKFSRKKELNNWRVLVVTYFKASPPFSWNKYSKDHSCTKDEHARSAIPRLVTHASAAWSSILLKFSGNVL